MTTIAEWQAHFETRTTDDLTELRRALKTLRADPMIRKNIDWLDLLQLAARNAEINIWRGGLKRAKQDKLSEATIGRLNKKIQALIEEPLD